MKIAKKLIILLDTSFLLRTTLLHVVLLFVYTALWLAFPSLQTGSTNCGIDFIIAIIDTILAISFVTSAIVVLMCLSVPVIKIVCIWIIQPALSGWNKIVTWARQ